MAGEEALANAVARALEQYRMLPEKGRIVVGLSGGADSMALADCLAARTDCRGRLVCAHVHHGIRGEQADADEALVRAWCARQGLPCEVLHADVPAEAARTGEGLEACGRRVRYAFFASLAPGEDDRIAVAHNADDQTETVLLRLLRGAGPRGLRGMSPVRGKVIRPLLFTPRAQVEAYCAARGLVFAQDATNGSDDYARNRLRHAVVPVLKELNPNLNATVAREVALLEQDETWLAALAREALQNACGRFPGSLRREALCSLPAPVLTRALRLWFETLGCPVEEKHLAHAAACLQTGGSFSPGGGFLCSSGAVEMTLTLPAATGEKTLVPGRTALLDGCTLSVQEMTGKQSNKIHNLLFKKRAGYDKISLWPCEASLTDCFAAADPQKAPLILRHRRPGDRFRPLERTEQPLQQFFTQARVPLPWRDRLWLLEQGGRVLWLEAFGPAQPGNEQDRLYTVHLRRPARP